jgi:outer membrane protein TolC
MNKKLFLYITIISLVSTYYLLAQEKIALTVEESIKIGLNNSRSLHSSLMNVDASTARYGSANASKLPNFKFTGGYARLSDIPAFVIDLPPALGGGSIPLNPTILNNYQTKVTIAQPIFTGFLLSSSSDMSEYLMMAAEKDYSKDKNELIYKIKESYWNLFRAKEFKKVIDENLKQMEAHLKDVKNLYDQGLATNNQVLQVQVQISNSKLNLIDADNNVKLLMIMLNNTIELPLETEIELTSGIEKNNYTDLTLKDLLQKSLNNRPELKSMEYKVKASEYGVKIANSNWYPQVFLNGNYYYNRPNARLMPAQDIFKDTWDISLGLSWDIWTWGKNNDKVTEAKANLSQAEDGFSIVKNGIKMEVTTNYLSLIKARQSIDVAEDGVKLAEENYKVTNDKFKNGMALNTDLLDAEVALLQAKINLTQALVNYELSVAKIQKSISE